jgi:hypothetical protein
MISTFIQRNSGNHVNVSLYAYGFDTEQFGCVVRDATYLQRIAVNLYYNRDLNSKWKFLEEFKGIAPYECINIKQRIMAIFF